jgi:hypothetical protein
MFSIERDTVYAKYKVEPLGSPDAGLQTGATRMGLQYQIKNGQPVAEVIYPAANATAQFVHPFHWEKA